MRFILDTNILLIYSRANYLAKKIEEDLQLLSPQTQVVISVVSLGEIKSISLRNNWGLKKIERLEYLLKNFMQADIKVNSIINKYAEIDAYSQGKIKGVKVDFSARNMGKNDLWIASTCSVLDLELVTTDNDFNHLSNKYIKLRKVDIKKY